ncbi:MAG TPA: lytic murein transglycosylase B [Thiobacillaceae bacterium]|nr:lytic murein transglycosylase B [Thiobacillaceae bacterium]
MIREWGLTAVMLFAVLASASDASWAKHNKRHKGWRTRPQVVETYAGRPEIEVIARELATQGVDPAFVRNALRQARKLEAVRKAIKPPPAGARKNWQAYRARFLDQEHIQAGTRFWTDNEAPLTQATKLFGVPEAVIVGILGVETRYGRNSGRYRVLDALATLSFDYPRGGKDRAAYFRGELAAFLLWCARSQCAPLSVHGSYAGAIGMAQFMPENIERFGMDLDGDGRIDLQNAPDAIGSVARFLALHGWVRDLLPCFSVNADGAQLATLLQPDIEPSFDYRQLEALGARATAALPPAERFAFVKLQNGDAPNQYFLGSRNFFVLTRYNRSAYYAKAVLELGQAVAEARGREQMTALRQQGEDLPASQ